MAEFFLEKPTAEIKQIARESVRRKGLRCYRHDPDGIMVQIRSHTEKKGQMANVRITLAEARRFADFLLTAVGESWFAD